MEISDKNIGIEPLITKSIHTWTYHINKQSKSAIKVQAQTSQRVLCFFVPWYRVNSLMHINDVNKSHFVHVGYFSQYKKQKYKNAHAIKGYI